MDVGERVALNGVAWTDGGGVAYANEVGVVIGHQGDNVIVSLDHGTNRVVTCPDTRLRRVRVAHPGTPRRSRERRR